MRASGTLRLVGLLAIALLIALPAPRPARGEKGTQGLTFQGFGRQGFGMQGFGFQGFGFQGFGRQGFGFQGFGFQGFGRQGFGFQGFGRQGFGRQGFGFQGFGMQGFGLQGFGRQGFGRQGFGRQGFGFQGFGRQGFGRQGFGRQGIGLQGLGLQGFGRQGFGRQGFGLQGFGRQGFGRQGFGLQGFGMQGFGLQGFGRQGFGRQGIAMEGTALRGMDRVGMVPADILIGSLRLSEVQLADGTAAQWVQDATELPLENLPTDVVDNVLLQKSPDDTADGSFICIPDGGGGCRSAAGTFWVLKLADVPPPDDETLDPEAEEPADFDDDFGLLLYVADVEVDRTLNQSKYPSNEDIYLYTVYFRHPVTAEWQSLCPLDVEGKPQAMAIPLDPYRRDEDSRRELTFACTGSGVGAKCARIWGYKPWETVTEQVWNGSTFEPREVQLKDFYDTCVVAARADYCQDGTSFTRNGTTVDLFDTLDGVSSLVDTAGLGYQPGSDGLMLHEEYQISVDKTVQALLQSTPGGQVQYDALSPDSQTLASLIQASGLQSSRYPDLDPGRSCPTSAFIDRCDPKKPYACYRANNMPAAGYGAFISINSPRHCTHPDTEVGEALDPLCNQCVTRVCQVDPTCCGDAGQSYYPGSLLWGQRCIDLRDAVCRTSPEGDTWAAGQVAEPAGSHAVITPRGAIGVLEGLVQDGPDRYAEGWACDPDHPEASVPVALALGSELGSDDPLMEREVVKGAADQELVPTYQSLVDVECGGGVRHGFKIALPGSALPDDEVFVYGIDLDRPGTPFTLLRGGQKTVAGAALVPAPNGLLWTGWLEPPATGDYGFEVSGTGPNDKYRVWVNGFLVAADATYPDPEEPEPEGLESPPPSPTVRLLKGVSVGIRVEQAGNDPESGIELRWTTPLDATPSEIPSEYLYPITEHAGNGLQPTYFEGTDFAGGGITEVLASNESHGEVDRLFPEPPPVFPAPGDTWEKEEIDAFPYSIRWEGQVMPPSSGIYTFTADADGPVSIEIEGVQVTEAAARPPIDEDTCSHDICAPGAAISKSCSQGSFCAARICETDPFCCFVTWDARCVEKVAPECAFDCSPAAPLEAFLSGGVKYRIKVEYQHAGGSGKMRLFWGLPGMPPEVIAEEALFSETEEGETPDPGLALGEGLNGTWFDDVDGTDEDFLSEPLHTTVRSLLFHRNDPSTHPREELSVGVICGDPGAPSCTGVVAPTRPVIVSPHSGDVIPGHDVTVLVAGVAAGPVEVLVDNGVVFTDTADASQGIEAPLTGLPFGEHELVARNVMGTEPLESAPVVIELRDPTALPALRVLAPTGTTIQPGSPVPFLVEGGSAGAELRTSIGGAPEVAQGTFLSGGTLTGELLLDPGITNVAFLQVLGTQQSPETEVAVRVRPPSLVVISPGDGSSVASPVPVSGGGANPALDVLVSDGDGGYFARLPSSAVAIAVAPDGSFAGTVALDHGVHRLKFFQNVGGVDGDMDPIELLVAPPGGLVIDEPEPDDNVPPRVTVRGHGGLARVGPGGTGQRSTAIVYQGTTKVGQGPIDDDGGFEVHVSLSPGDQTLSVSQLVPSLSGAGPAESAPSTPGVLVHVKPPAPVITSPFPGQTLVSLLVPVAGTALPNATVNVYADGLFPPTTTVADPDGLFATSLSLAKGTHALTARQMLPGGIEGPASAQILISTGDVTPPVLSVVTTDVREEATSLAGIAVDFGCVDPLVLDPTCNVTALDDVNGARPVSCSPPSGAVFPVGSTTVICEASDLSSNVGRTSFLVSVTSPIPPTINAPNLTVEAEGPDGAAVPYLVSAHGSVGDCSPPGLGEIRACARWEPANGGLGFTPLAMATDPNPESGEPSAIYAIVAEQYPQIARLFRSQNEGADWTELGSPGLWPLGLLLPRGEPGTLYVPWLQGMKKSTDGGETFDACFPPEQINDVVGASLNQALPGRLVLWGGRGGTLGPPPFVLASPDGCQNWTPLSLTGVLAAGEYPLVVAEDPTSDPINARYYMSTYLGPTTATRLYRKVGAGPWQQLNVPPGTPPGDLAAHTPARTIHLIPDAVDHAVVITSTVISFDRGNSWAPLVDELGVYFEAASVEDDGAGFLVAAARDGVRVSTDFGHTWSAAQGVALEQVALDAMGGPTPPVFYGRELVGGLSRSDDGGEVWDRLELPGLSLNDGLILDLDVDPVNPGVAYLLKAQDGLFKTDDGGHTWHSMRGGFDMSPGRESDLTFAGRQIAIDPFQRAFVYVGGGELWKSTNAAGTWTQLAAAGVSAPRGPKGAFGLDPYAFQTLYWTPWGQAQVWRSTNAGGTFASAGDAPTGCEPDGDIAFNDTGTGFPSPVESDDGAGGAGGTVWEVLDGETEYTDTADHGVVYAAGQAHQLTVDFGDDRSFDQVEVWHHLDTGEPGHNIPQDATIEVFQGSSWNLLSGVTRTTDLGYTQPVSGFGSFPDTYEFPTVTGSKVRWSFDGSGPSLTGAGASPNDVVSLATGALHSCAVTQEGLVYCWGDNNSGQLGTDQEETSFSEYPLLVEGVSGAISVAAGEDHTCALLGTGEVACWGRGDDGQLGDGIAYGPGAGSDVPVLVDGIEDAVVIASGQFHTCAIRDDGVEDIGQVRCWGRGTDGQLGNGGLSSLNVPDTVLAGPATEDALSGATRIAAGLAHTCAVLDDGRAMCWGFGGIGSLGNGGFGDTSTPVQVDGLGPGFDFDVQDIAAGEFHTCALVDGGGVFCWGYGIDGQLGDGSTGTFSNVPVPVATLAGATAIAAGQYHTCAAFGGGAVACWGLADDGELGGTQLLTCGNGDIDPFETCDDGNDVDSDTCPNDCAPSVPLGAVPVFVPGIHDVSLVAGGEAHSCALSGSSHIWCWGFNAFGQLGDGSTSDADSPVTVSGFEGPGDAVSLGASSHAACAVRATGEVECWGPSNPVDSGSVVPGAVPELEGALEVTVGTSHLCALLPGGEATCVGDNSQGQLSSSQFISRPDIAAISAGGQHTCAIYESDGQKVACWGAQAMGQLGNGSFDQATGDPDPFTIPGLSPVAVSAGEEHTCEVEEGGEVLCWGSGLSGRLGDGIDYEDASEIGAPTPVTVVGLDDAVDVSAGVEHTCAVHATGEVSCWGNGGSGRLGDGTGLSSNVPTTVSIVGGGPALTGVTQVAAGGEHTCAVLDDGQVACWGRNLEGQLGNGTLVSSPTPVFALGVHDAIAVATGELHTCALSDTGAVRCWGLGTGGELGDGSLKSAVLPIFPTGFGSGDDAYTPWIYELSVNGCDPESAPSAAAAGDGLEIQFLPGLPRQLVYTTDVDTFISSGGALDDWTPLGTGESPVLVDPSTHPPTFYVGGAGIGQDPSQLYKSTNPPSGFVPVGGDPGMVVAAFRRFALDTGGNGAMYAIGDGFTFMVSPDRGASWYQDAQAPIDTKITNLWVSPVDGAVFASVIPSRYADDESWWDRREPSPGNLWKRSTQGALPPGARVVQAEIRPVCAARLPPLPPPPDPDPYSEQRNRSVQSGATFPLGGTDIQCTAIDVFNNSADATFTVTVEDTTPPEINIPEELLATAPTGGSAQVTFQASATDAVDGPVAVSCNQAPGSPFSVNAGTVQSVTCTATDSHGNPATRAFTVVVSEEGQPPTVPPTLTVPGDMLVEATGSDGAPVTFAPAPTAQSADGTPITPTCTPVSGSTFALGTTTVSCDATDSVGTVTKTFKVRVQDKTAPVINLPSVPPATAEGSWGAIVSFSVDATDSVDPAPSVQCSPGSGSAFSTGNTTVVCNASDHAGNLAQASFVVTVEDNGPPVLSLPNLPPQPATNSLGAIVDFMGSVSATDPEGGVVTVSCIPESGSLFPLGDTEVFCTATDPLFNQARGSFMVHVEDQQAPDLFLPEPSPVVVEAEGPQGAQVSYNVSASDSVDGVPALSCVRLRPAGAATPVPTTGTLFPIGLWEVSCTATDLAGNQTTDSFGVQVRDTTSPVLTLPGDLEVTIGTPVGAPVPFVATATDTVNGSLPVACNPAPGSVFHIGATLVGCVTRDLAGNETRGTFRVTLIYSNQPPVLSLPGDLTVEATGAAGAVVNYVATASDPEDGAIAVECTPPSGFTFPFPGTTTVACGASDSGGRTAAGSFDVTVVDTTPPVVTVPENFSVEATDPTGAVVTFPSSADDLVSGAIPPTCTPASGTFFLEGTTDVTCEATDGAGNTGEATFQVTVGDTVGPVFVNVPDTVHRYATSKHGARVFYQKPKARDEIDGWRPVHCSPRSGRWFSPNQTTVTCTASDRNGNESSAVFVVWVTFDTGPDSSFFLWPVRNDGRSLFRVGRSVPVRFRLRGDSANIRDLDAELFVTKISDFIFGTIEEPDDEPADFGLGSDASFRYLPWFHIYEARWRTRRESRGTYLVRADLGDGVPHQVTVSLR